MTDRARLTLIDLVYILMALAYLGALYPVFSSSLESNSDSIAPGPGLLLQLILPITVLVLLTVIWVKTIGGR